MNAVDWSIQWWRKRHDRLYFPDMEQHKNWRVYGPEDLWFVEMFDPKLDEYDDVLEIGCGYGQWMVPVSRLVRSVVGVDIHESLQAKAAEKFIENDCKHTCYRMGDGKSLNIFGDKMFSAVYSISVFQHMPRATVTAYLAESYRVLRESGRGLFHFRQADGVGEYSKDILVNHTGDFSTGWTGEEALQAARDAGFPRFHVHDLGQSLILLTWK